MELNVPDWLDEQFLTTALKDAEDKDAKIEDVMFSVSPAVAPGNNYLSYMYRVRVEYKTRHDETSHGKSISLMVKEPFVDGFMKQLAQEYDFFQKEPKIYNDLLPSLCKVTSCEFGPKSFHCPVKNVLVLKDLKEEGYFLSDKTKQLDFCHSKAVLEKLAKFHAASVICLNNNKELVREVGMDLLFVETSSVGVMVEQSLKNTVKVICADERFTKLAEFILKRYDKIWPSFSKLTKPKTDGGLNVLNHGDLWVNNMLFKYKSSGEVDDVKFIDYQLSRLGSPVNDLVYFIWTSTNEEVRSHRQKELFSIYLSTLNKTLAALGSDERLSEQELRDDVIRSADFVIAVVSHFVPFMMASPEDAPDLKNLSDVDFESEKYHKVFKGKTFKKFLPKYFEQLTEFFFEGKGMPGQNN